MWNGTSTLARRLPSAPAASDLSQVQAVVSMETAEAMLEPAVACLVRLSPLRAVPRGVRTTWDPRPEML